MQHFSASIARLAATPVTAVTVTGTDVNLIQDKIETCSMKPATQQYQRTLREVLADVSSHSFSFKKKNSLVFRLYCFFELRPDNSI